MKMFRKLAVAAVAATVMSAEAGAQIDVNFFTTGSFTGCGFSAVFATFAICDVGTAELRYDFNGSAVTPDLKTLTTVLPTAAVQYGAFTTTTTGGATVNVFSGINFTLNLFQLVPSVGNQPLLGSITGGIAANSGGLLWGPVNPTNWQIGAVKWTLDVDAGTNSVRIDSPNSVGAGLPQTIRGTVSVVPEPSTYALMAAGLAALGMVARRRRTVA